MPYKIDVKIISPDISILADACKRTANHPKKEETQTMKHPTIEIKRGNSNGGRQVTQIFVDGHPIHGVRSFKLEQDTSLEIPVLTLEINALDISIDSPMTINHARLGNVKDIIFENEGVNAALHGRCQTIVDCESPTVAPSQS